MTGTGNDPTTCRDTAPGRLKQLVYQRARGRAVARLIRAHQDEYDDLLAAEKKHAQAEAAALDLTAKQNGKADKGHPDEPVRLKTGRRGKGQTVLDRLDVARCPHCIRHHDKGHVCPNCGTKPGDAPPQQPPAQPVRRGPVTRIPTRPTRTTTVDPAALAEFNAGTQRAADADRNTNRRSTAS